MVILIVLNICTIDKTLWHCIVGVTKIKKWKCILGFVSLNKQKLSTEFTKISKVFLENLEKELEYV